MFDEIEYNLSAFKHGISEEGIHWFFHYRYVDPVEDIENKYLSIGFGRTDNLLEIMYNEIDKHIVNIFHDMMKYRSFYYPLLKV
jgi:hypothetical protein